LSSIGQPRSAPSGIPLSSYPSGIPTTPSSNPSSPSSNPSSPSSNPSSPSGSGSIGTLPRKTGVMEESGGGITIEKPESKGILANYEAYKNTGKPALSDLGSPTNYFNEPGIAKFATEATKPITIGTSLSPPEGKTMAQFLVTPGALKSGYDKNGNLIESTQEKAVRQNALQLENTNYTRGGFKQVVSTPGVYASAREAALKTGSFAYPTTIKITKSLGQGYTVPTEREQQMALEGIPKAGLSSATFQEKISPKYQTSYFATLTEKYPPPTPISVIPANISKDDLTKIQTGIDNNLKAGFTTFDVTYDINGKPTTKSYQGVSALGGILSDYSGYLSGIQKTGGSVGYAINPRVTKGGLPLSLSGEIGTPTTERIPYTPAELYQVRGNQENLIASILNMKNQGVSKVSLIDPTTKLPLTSKLYDLSDLYQARYNIEKDLLTTSNEKNALGRTTLPAFSLSGEGSATRLPLTQQQTQALFDARAAELASLDAVVNSGAKTVSISYQTPSKNPTQISPLITTKDIPVPLNAGLLRGSILKALPTENIGGREYPVGYSIKYSANPKNVFRQGSVSNLVDYYVTKGKNVLVPAPNASNLVDLALSGGKKGSGVFSYQANQALGTTYDVLGNVVKQGAQIADVIGNKIMKGTPIKQSYQEFQPNIVSTPSYDAFNVGFKAYDIAKTSGAKAGLQYLGEGLDPIGQDLYKNPAKGVGEAIAFIPEALIGGKALQGGTELLGGILKVGARGAGGIVSRIPNIGGIGARVNAGARVNQPNPAIQNVKNPYASNKAIRDLYKIQLRNVPKNVFSKDLAEAIGKAPEEVNVLGRKGNPPILRTYPTEGNIPSGRTYPKQTPRAEAVTGRTFTSNEFLKSTGKSGSPFQTGNDALSKVISPKITESPLPETLNPLGRRGKPAINTNYPIETGVVSRADFVAGRKFLGSDFLKATGKAGSPSNIPEVGALRSVPSAKPNSVPFDISYSPSKEIPFTGGGSRGKNINYGELFTENEIPTSKGVPREAPEIVSDAESKRIEAANAKAQAKAEADAYRMFSKSENIRRQFNLPRGTHIPKGYTLTQVNLGKGIGSLVPRSGRGGLPTTGKGKPPPSSEPFGGGETTRTVTRVIPSGRSALLQLQKEVNQISKPVKTRQTRQTPKTEQIQKRRNRRIVEEGYSQIYRYPEETVPAGRGGAGRSIFEVPQITKGGSKSGLTSGFNFGDLIQIPKTITEPIVRNKNKEDYGIIPIESFTSKEIQGVGEVYGNAQVFKASGATITVPDQIITPAEKFMFGQPQKTQGENIMKPPRGFFDFGIGGGGSSGKGGKGRTAKRYKAFAVAIEPFGFSGGYLGEYATTVTPEDVFGKKALAQYAKAATPIGEEYFRTASRGKIKRLRGNGVFDEAMYQNVNLEDYGY
jgi:hypothetical protein